MTLTSRLGQGAGTRVFNYLAIRSGSDIATMKAIHAGLEGSFRVLPLHGISEILGCFFDSELWAAIRKDINNCKFIKQVFDTYLRIKQRDSDLAYDTDPIQAEWTTESFIPCELKGDLDRFLKKKPAGRAIVESRTASHFYLSLCTFVMANESIKPMIPVLSRHFAGSIGATAQLSLLVELFLYFVIGRSVPAKKAFSSLLSMLDRGRIPPVDLLLVLHDFYEDNRYSKNVLTVLLALASTAVRSFYEKRRRIIMTVLNLEKDLIRISRAGALEYAKTVLELHVSHPYIDITNWVQEGARIVRRYGERSAAARTYFSRKSDLSMRLWREADIGVQFDEVSARLHTFVQAVTERNIDLRVSTKKTVEGFDNVFYTDGHTVYVPRYVGHAQTKEDNYTVLLHSTAHECGHIEFGSFADDSHRYKAASRRLNKLFPGQFAENRAKMYEYINGLKHRLDELGYTVTGISFAEDRLPRIIRLLFHAKHPPLLRDMWNIAEDRRIDQRVFGRYRGFAKEKAFVDGLDFRTVPDISTVSGAANLVTALAQQLGFGRIKGQLEEGNRPYFEKMLEHIEASKDPETADAYDTLMTAAALYKILTGYLQERQPELLNQLEQEEISFSGLQVSQNPRNAPIQIDIAWHNKERRERNYRLGRRNGFSDEALPGKATEIVQKHHGAAEPIIGLSSFKKAYSYPEWDFHRNTYMTDHCALYDCNLPAPKDGYRRSFAGLVANVAEVRRAFSALKPKDMELLRGLEDGQEVDFDRYFDSLMDLKTGHEMEHDFYMIRAHRVRSVASALVLDMSPSTAEVIQGDTIFAHEQSATYLSAEAMHAIGDRFGIYSFFDYGPEATLFYTIKAIDEVFGAATVKRLDEFLPATRGWSRLSVGLRHLIDRFKNIDAKSRIIFLITDGLPFYYEGTKDEGKTAKRYTVDGRVVESAKPVPVLSVNHRGTDYAIGDLRKVYEEASVAGIRLFCITLDEKSIPVMSRIFDTSLIYLPDISQLPGRLVQVFRAVAV